jgi:hypothetical protein
MTGAGEQRPPRLFLSYSHRNENWRDLFLEHLTPLSERGSIDVWYDARIEHGEDWFDRIAVEIKRSRFIVVLLTADFLDSDFIRREELPYIEYLWSAATQGDRPLTIYAWVCEPCRWQEVSLFSEQGSRIQCAPRSGSLAECPDDERSQLLSHWVAGLEQAGAGPTGSARTQMLVEDARNAYARGKASLEALDYRSACASFEEAERLFPEFADAHYFHAIALLGGRRAKKVTRQTITRVERHLMAAINARGSFLDLFMLGLFKWDYYQENKLKMPPPTTEQLLEAAVSGDRGSTFSQYLLDETFRHTPWIDTAVTRWLTAEG